MPEALTTERSLTDRANEQERKWDWLGAAETYEKVLTQVPDDDHLQTGDILERRAYALHRSALQADTIEEFEVRNREAIEIYAKASKAHGSTSDKAATGWVHRCEAMTSYLEYWLAGDSAEKRRLVDKAWKDTKSSLSFFEAQGMCRDFALTFNQLSYAAAFSYDYGGEAESRENILKEALSCAEKSIRYLSALKDNESLARAHAKAAALLTAIECDFASYSDKDKVDLDSLDHWVKAKELAEDAAACEVPFIVILQSWPSAMTIEDRYANYVKGKEIAEKARDHFMIGCALDGLAQRKFLLARTAGDPDQMKALSDEGFEISKTARENLAKVRFISPNFVNVWVHVPEAGYYYYLATETRDPELRRDLIYKAQHPCMEQLKAAENSGYPDIRCAAYFMLGSVLKDLGKNESGIDMKRSYLEQAVERLTVAIDQDRRIHPTDYLPQGMDLLSFAEAKFEIARITSDIKKKTVVLREAVDRKQEGLGLCEKELNANQNSNPEISSEIAEGYRETGSWAKELCTISDDNSCLKLVAECLEKAVLWYSKAGLSSQSAEANWEAAQVYDKLGEFFKAAERFDSAAEDYRKAADSVPRLDEFYADHAIYMRAWGEIERGRYHHMRQEPEMAKDSYEAASAMHKSSRRWSYLAPNYSAWAQVEHAEDISRNENNQEAAEVFDNAARLFQESKKSLHDQLAKIQDSSEKQTARQLERAADTRRDYCKARIVLENARSLDKEGDVSASADKYGQAASLFDKILEGLESDQDRKEIRLVATLSKAWQAMATAEGETSPSQYDRASQLFDEARDLSTGEKNKLLMAGHSRFCKALGIGARFVDTGDVTLHAEATKHLESAASYYLKADHRKESDYAKSSKLLFDAYIHMGKASREEDQVKKARLYMMAEKVLQTSASSYDKAKEPSKRDQVLRLLEKVKEDRELALSLTEVLHAPDVVSQTAAFPSPTPSHESATGLERFEHADIQAALIAHPKHLHVGQDLEIVIEMTNAGKGAAVLTRVEEVFPKGFIVIGKPDTCQIEDNHISMRGRRLDALGSEVVKLVLKPTCKGIFLLRPRILYQDESGVAKDKETEPVEITVRELGLSGWLKGT